jgi:hypothetical protein
MFGVLPLDSALPNCEFLIAHKEMEARTSGYAHLST